VQEPSKILFISPQPFMADRGSPLRVKSTLIALHELGYEIDLLAFPLGEPVELSGVRILRSANPFGVNKVPIGLSWRKSLLDLSLFWKACSLARKERYLLFHGIEEAALVARLLGKIFSRPWIMDMHSSMADQVRDMRFLGSGLLSKSIGYVEESCLKSASGVMTVSDDLTGRANGYRVANSSPGNGAFTLFDLPLPLPVATNEQVTQLRESFGIESNERVLLYTGNLKEYQGVELLIKGFARFLKNHSESNPAVKLLVVGGGSEEQEEKKQFEDLILELGLSEKILMVGLRPSNEMGAFYSMADILVSPRLSGTNTPLKIYSYLEAQKPVLASRILSHTQVLTEQSAFLFELDPEDFAKVLSSLLQNPELQKEKVKHGLALINNQFSRKVFLDRLGKLYHSAVGTAPSVGRYAHSTGGSGEN